MRVFLVLCAALAIGAGGYFGYGLKKELDVLKAVHSARVAEERSGIRQTLSNHPRYRFEQVVLGPGATDDTREFRARIKENGISQSVYGVIARGCEAEASLAEPGCWRLQQLVIDGVDVESVTPARVSEDPPPVEPAPALAVAAAIDTDIEPDPVPAEAIPDNPAPVDTSAAATEAVTAVAPVAASHSVRLTLVNARSQPSTQGSVEAQLAGNTGLFLLEQNGGWGRFRVLDGEHQDLEVWVALSVLNKAELQ